MNIHKELEVANGMGEKNISKASTDHKTLLTELKHMKQSGQVSSKEFLYKMKQLEIILGINRISPFGTNEKIVFEDRLQEMTKADMEKVAIKIGLNPIHQRAELKKALLREFDYYARGTSRNIMPEGGDNFVIDPNNAKHQKLLQALG